MGDLQHAADTSRATIGPIEGDEDIETRALERTQAERAATEHEEAEQAISPDEAAAHERRADKAEYLREKLEERAEAEREAAAADD